MMNESLEIGTKIRLIDIDNVDMIVGLEENDEGIIIGSMDGTFSKLYLIDFLDKSLTSHPVSGNCVEEIDDRLKPGTEVILVEVDSQDLFSGLSLYDRGVIIDDPDNEESLYLVDFGSLNIDYYVNRNQVTTLKEEK